MKILTLCTGNAARSVMLGFMIASLAVSRELSWDVRTAGTHTSEGQAMSPRTLAALQRLDALSDQRFTQHRSHQLTRDDVEWADIILAAEADHVALCRSNFPESRERVVQMAALVRDDATDRDFLSLVREVAARAPSADDDVADPAGGDQAAYDYCADQLWAMAQQFAHLVSSNSRP